MKLRGLIGLLIIVSASNSIFAQKLLDGDFWKKQALNDIIPAWQKQVFDKKDGGFHAHLKRNWKPYKNEHQYPGMISRQLFSFSAAYLLSGEKQYLNDARKTFDYMVRHGWDKTYGGWYDAVNDQGRPLKSAKDLFMQTYAISGLTLFYAATKDSTAMAYLKKSYNILQKYAWDEAFKGYYRKLNRNLSVANTVKDFSPQLAPASGFLTYLYPISRKKAYKRQFKTLMNIAWVKMRHPRAPWIMESFDKKWQMINGQNKSMNVGHNLEVVWLMLRLYHLTGEEKYKQKALTLTQPLNEQAFDESSGAWYHKIPVDNPENKDSTTTWWVQAYGNMTQLYLYRVTKAEHYLERFRKGANFWNKAFLDKKYGGTVLKADLNGKVIKGDKAVRTKTAYHAMEHGLLNYLYLNLWVAEKPVKLHYHLSNTEKGETFYPSFLVDPKVRIKQVKINGRDWSQFDAKQGFISLPKSKTSRIQVTFEYQ